MYWFYTLSLVYALASDEVGYSEHVVLLAMVETFVECIVLVLSGGFLSMECEHVVYDSVCFLCKWLLSGTTKVISIRHLCA